MHPALFASGDDEGVVRIWDLRAPTKACAELKVHEDFVSDLQVATGPPTAAGPLVEVELYLALRENEHVFA